MAAGKLHGFDGPALSKKMIDWTNECCVFRLYAGKALYVSLLLYMLYSY
jgi:hypothetical protein